MPPIGVVKNKPVQPATDQEWEDLTDEELSRLSGQRAESERVARQNMEDIREKVAIARNGRPERLAVNVFDLERIVSPVLRAEVAGRLDGIKSRFVRLSKEDQAMPFKEDIDLLVAAAACDIVRNECRQAKDQSIRVYVCRDSKWRKLPDDAVLCITEADGTVSLNPDVFEVFADPESSSPLPPTVIEM